MYKLQLFSAYVRQWTWQLTRDVARHWLGGGGFRPPKLNVSPPPKKKEFANFNISVWKCTNMHYFIQNTFKNLWGWGTAPSPSPTPDGERYTRSPDLTPSAPVAPQFRHGLDAFGDLVSAPWWPKSPHSENPGYVSAVDLDQVTTN